MPCFGHMWSIRYRSTMRHKLANRMAQQARILTITNIKYRWKPPAASLDIENENIQLRHENSTATSRNNFLASTVLNDCAHFLHHSKWHGLRQIHFKQPEKYHKTRQSLWRQSGRELLYSIVTNFFESLQTYSRKFKIYKYLIRSLFVRDGMPQSKNKFNTII